MSKNLFYDEYKIKDIKSMICDDEEIIKNGKVLVKCKDCETCPLCEKISFEVYTGPNTFQRVPGYKCGKDNTYSEDITKLKKSKINSKRAIEEKKSFEKVEEKYKRRREKYITEETIKECIKVIKNCLSAEYGTYNEYGHEVIMLESIEIRKSEYGYILTHDGRIGDEGWYNTIRIHKKCNVKKLADELRRTFKHSVKNEGFRI